MIVSVFYHGFTEFYHLTESPHPAKGYDTEFELFDPPHILIHFVHFALGEESHHCSLFSRFPCIDIDTLSTGNQGVLNTLMAKNLIGSHFAPDMVEYHWALIR